MRLKRIVLYQTSLQYITNRSNRGKIPLQRYHKVKLITEYGDTPLIISNMSDKAMEI